MLLRDQLKMMELPNHENLIPENGTTQQCATINQYQVAAGTNRKISKIYESLLGFLRLFEVAERRFKLVEQVAQCGNILMKFFISVSRPEPLLL
jgi:hypothetical protein